MSDTGEQMVRRIAFRDYRTISLVEMTIDEEGLIVVGGNNASGKTCVLDALEEVLVGRKIDYRKPIRDGAEEAVALVETDDFEATRFFRKDGTSEVRVKRKETGRKCKKAELTDLVEPISFDFQRFLGDPPAIQAQTLLKALGVDAEFHRIRAERDIAFGERTDLGRRLKAAKAVFEGMGGDRPVTGTAKDPADVVKALKDRQNKMDALSRWRTRVNREYAEIDRLDIQISQLMKDLEAARERLATLEMEAPPEVQADTAEIEEQLAEIEEHNSAVRASEEAARKWDEAKSTAEALEVEHALKDGQIASMDANVAMILEAADMPIPELGIDMDGTITYRGQPLNQASQREKIQAVCGIGKALNPKMRVILIRDASSVDKNGWRWLDEFARENRLQIWAEDPRAEHPTIMIVDGRTAQPDGGDVTPAAGARNPDG